MLKVKKMPRFDNLPAVTDVLIALGIVVKTFSNNDPREFVRGKKIIRLPDGRVVLRPI